MMHPETLGFPLRQYWNGMDLQADLYHQWFENPEDRFEHDTTCRMS